MQGKKKCKILREIRRKIATENDIPYVTEDCKYKGDCKGTCPRCESELRYLEQQLEKRRSLGKAVTVSAVALGLMTSAAGCGPVTTSGDFETNPAKGLSSLTGKTEYVEVLDGEIAPPEATEDDTATSDDPTEVCSELEGDIAYSTDPTDESGLYTELAGAIAPPAENGGND